MKGLMLFLVFCLASSVIAKEAGKEVSVTDALGSGAKITVVHFVREKGMPFLGTLYCEIETKESIHAYDPNLKIDIAGLSGNKLFFERKPVKTEYKIVDNWDLRKFRVKIRFIHLEKQADELRELTLFWQFSRYQRDEQQAEFHLSSVPVLSP